MILAQRAQLAASTRGAEGALFKNRIATVEVASPVVDVVDTVGAGDAFPAGLVRWLWANSSLSAQTAGKLDRDGLADGLPFAAAVGALQCSQAGAAPPTLAQVGHIQSRLAWT